jgi:hypothetical protein
MMKMDLLFILYALPATILGYLIHIIIHEIGHMLAGLVTGWKFVVLQLFYITIAKKKVIQVEIVPVFGCQCIMSPKSLKQDSGLYSLGGIMFNLLITGISVYGTIKLRIGTLPWLFSFCFASCGIGIILMNGIPNTKKLCNDMACFLFCSRDKAVAYYHNAQLMIAGQLSEGKSYRQLDASIVHMRREKASNDILAYQAVLEFYYHLDCDAYIPAGKALNKIELNQQVCWGTQKVIKMEALYYDMLMDLLHKNITVLDNPCYGPKIDQYIKMHDTAGDIHMARVKAVWAAYQCYKDGDITAAIECLNKAMIELQSMRCLYQGEKIFCIDQLQGIRNILWRDSVMIG